METNQSKATLLEWANEFYKVHGEKAKILIPFLLASQYKAMIVETAGSFPLMLLQGGFFTGKTQSMFSLAATITPNPKQILLGAGTDNSFYRCINSSFSVIDEFDSAEIKRIDWMKRSSISATLSPIIFASQKMPEDNTLINRCIPVVCERINDTKESFLLLDEFKKKEVAGAFDSVLTNPTIPSDTYLHAFKYFMNLLNVARKGQDPNFTCHHVLENIAKVIAITAFFDLPWTKEELLDYGLKIFNDYLGNRLGSGEDSVSDLITNHQNAIKESFDFGLVSKTIEHFGWGNPNELVNKGYASHLIAKTIEAFHENEEDIDNMRYTISPENNVHLNAAYISPLESETRGNLLELSFVISSVKATNEHLRGHQTEDFDYYWRHIEEYFDFELVKKVGNASDKFAWIHISSVEDIKSVVKEICEDAYKDYNNPNRDKSLGAWCYSGGFRGLVRKGEMSLSFFLCLEYSYDSDVKEDDIQTDSEENDFDKIWSELSEQINYQRIYKTMKAVDWNYYDKNGSNYIPGPLMLKHDAKALVKKLYYARMNGESTTGMGDGGFSAHWVNNTIELSFNLTSASADIS